MKHGMLTVGTERQPAPMPGMAMAATPGAGVKAAMTVLSFATMAVALVIVVEFAR